ncbi:hypothetical protein [Lysinibacter sp. HNR]|uniref:hypothetical protein n=1 Tax=Lysinibacter sp. HNR TaxID=3031408 RepID=UPI0024356BB7|nr:hypothetical protein [Lysinibacter sp. HNR]WGD37733.1 hypothetical protein FrondiHNR_02125 [Lysinibacter sp. HNR]
MAHKRRIARWFLWAIMGVVAVSLIVASAVIIPIVTHVDAGPAQPIEQEAERPFTASAVGPDGRTRTLSVFQSDGVTPADVGSLTPGDRLVVRGSGFDSQQGIYVALCKNPEDQKVTPSPCLGGIPEDATEEKSEGDAQEFIESTWITDNWAWRAFATRGFEDSNSGTFTAYLRVPEMSDDSVDCSVDQCAIVTRNDHTALSDRSQDVLLNVSY